MNKSIEYIKNRIIDTPKSIKNIPLKGWDEATIYNPMDLFIQLYPELEEIIKENSMKLLIQSDKKECYVEIIYDPNETFDFFTTEISVHDGTLLFTLQTASELLNKLLLGRIYYKPKITKEAINNPFNYNYKYIIGDLLLHRDFGMKKINSFDMQGETDTFVLPIKFEYIKK